MRRELLIAAGPGEWRAALVEDGVAVELHVERGDRREAGSLHLGRVVRRVPALGAVLVDIGDEQPVFLPFGEALGDARLDEGARALVQIRREAQAGKGARATMRALLRGRHIELRIGRPGLLGADAFPAGLPASGEGAGWGWRILEPAPAEAVLAEAEALAARWHELVARAERLQPPARLDPAASHAAALAAAVGAPDRILCDEPGAIPELRAAFASAEILHRAAADWPLALDPLFEAALGPSLAVGAGAVHFEPTRAGTMIDLDTGTAPGGNPQRNALDFNLAAAPVIARQIRLRALGGGIVVDFVGLDRADWRARLRAALAEALAADPARPQILGWTRLGHLELVRPRRRRPLAEALLMPAPGGVWVETPATMAYEALRTLRDAARAEPARSWRIRAEPAVAAALAGAAAEALRGLEARLARPLAITADAEILRFQIEPA